MTNAQQNNHWPHITALLDQKGGHISIGSMPPIEGAAIAVNDQALIASLVHREGETFPELLQRLDTAIGKALHEGAVTNEVNGGRFRLAPRASARSASRLGNSRTHLRLVSPGPPHAAMRPGAHGYVERDLQTGFSTSTIAAE